MFFKRDDLMQTRTAAIVITAIFIAACASQPGPINRPGKVVDEDQYQIDWNDCASYSESMMAMRRADPAPVTGSGQRRNQDDFDAPEDEIDYYDDSFDAAGGDISGEGDSLMLFRECMAERGYLIRN